MKAIFTFFSLVTAVINLSSQNPEPAMVHDRIAGKCPFLVIHGLKLEFARIPAGEILIGSDDRPDEMPVHKVHIDSFDISATEVTVRQFRAFVQATNYITDAEKDGHSFACCWRPKLGISWRNPGFLQSDEEPVVGISWNDAAEYCRWISDETGDEYRLPSEAEWEYVCKTGYSAAPLDSVAWYAINSGGRTHQAGTKQCNNYGLYDMLGNAWEWTSDVYHDSYEGAPDNGNPWLKGGSTAQRGYVQPGNGRVLRGGSWGLNNVMHPVSYDLRISSRPVFDRNNSCNNSGFRLARNIKHEVLNETGNDNDLTACGEKYKFTVIPAGDFTMGDGVNGDKRSSRHILLRSSFRIGTAEITVRQFRSFVESTGYLTEAEKNGSCWDSDFRSRHSITRVKGLNWKNPGFEQSDEHPVTCVTWNDAMAFCNWLSNETGKIIRLPSEAEWEWAACAGRCNVPASRYDTVCWYYENSGMTTHKAGLKQPGLNGLYDMLGNVSEWTMDIWTDDYESIPGDGSSLLGIPSNARVIRGGSFEREASEMSLSGRDWYDQSEKVLGTGFRIVDAGPCRKLDSKITAP